MSVSLLGGLLGLVAGLGAWTVLSRTPRLRRPRLADRVAPFVRGSSPSRLLAPPTTPLTPFPTLEQIVRPALRSVATRLDTVLGGSASTRARLRRAGLALSLEGFRLQQAGWAAAALLAGLMLTLPPVLGGRLPPGVLVGVTLAMAASGVVARDYALSRSVRQRERRIAAELPTVAEMLALAVAAGESPLAAIERIVTISRGELSSELAAVVAQARTGVPLTSALDQLAAATAVASVARFVDGLVIAIERGTPVAEVLRAQAVDAREAGRRELLAAGGRKEISMMLPVVFLVLPVTVIFALFPGFYGLSLST